MKRFSLIITTMLLLSAVATPTFAEIKFGVRGGLNITKLTFSSTDLTTENRSGFYLGPTVKIDLPFGFDVEGSVIYNQSGGKTVTDDEDYADLDITRKSIAIPVNLRKGFGLGDTASLFFFAGPQIDFNISKDQGYKDIWSWNWKSSVISVNVGAGVMLMSHFEVRANYNIPCGDTSTFKVLNAATNAKAGNWQIGAAYYF